MKYLLQNNITLYICFCIPAVFFLLNPAKFPSDDGFFYPQIAYNFIHGKGSYFNDLYLTNGYHPLWMLVCVFAELINPFGKQNVVCILWFFQVSLVIGSFRKLDIFFQNNLTGKIVAYFTISVLFFSLGTLYLIEAHLNLFCFSMLLSFLAFDKKNDWLFGVLFSLVFLSRLDNIFLLTTLSLYYFYQRKWHFQSFLKSGFPILFFCSAYLWTNWYWFGGFVPISGRIKSSFPEIPTQISFNNLSIFFITISLIYTVFLSVGKNIPFRLLKLSFTLGVLLQLLYNLLFQSQIGQWYYVAQMLVLIFLIYDAINLILNKNSVRFFNYALITISLLISCSIGYLKATSNFSLQNTLIKKPNYKDDSKDKVQNFAKELRTKLPKNARAFTYDFPGKLAFYSDLEIIPADGLVANTKYFQDITNLDFETFLRNNKISYIILPSAFTGNDVPYYLGISVSLFKKQPTYSIRNPLTKRVVSPIIINNFILYKSYLNPIKTYQKEYDSISVYNLK